MTIKKFFLIVLLQAVVLAALKFVYFGSINYGSMGWEVLYCAVVAVAAVFFARGIGYMNYLEAIFAAFLWVVLNLLVDLFVFARVYGLGVFTSVGLWVGYGTMAVFVFIGHKKRHIGIRRGELHETHHH